MRKLTSVLVALGLVAVSLSFGDINAVDPAIAQSTAQVVAPTYTIGDFWVTEVSIGKEKYTTRMSVVGGEVLDGTDCWILNVEDPTLGTPTSQKAWVPKSDPTFSMVKMEAEGTGTNPFTMAESSFSMVKELSLDFPDGSPWPLEVGKKFTAVTSMRQVTVMGKAQVMGEIRIGETRIEITTGSLETYKVEKRERVKVPAGKFNCLKIVVFNEKGESYRTLWYSEEVKCVVKDIITGKSMSAYGKPTKVRIKEGKLKDYSLSNN